MPVCNKCMDSMQFVATIEKNDQLYHFYTCMKCHETDHEITYKFRPYNCPKHQWEHLGTEFKDDKTVHSILQVDRCDRCGSLRKTPRHTTEAGFSGRVDPEDPRLNLLWNRSSAGLFFDKEELKEINPPDIAAIPTEKEV